METVPSTMKNSRYILYSFTRKAGHEKLMNDAEEDMECILNDE